MLTNSNLATLDDGPTHRGAAERINLQGIIGWCLCVDQPGQPVKLSLFCEGLHIGVTATVVARPDISEKLGEPVAAGFLFHWKEISPDTRLQLTRHLQDLGEAASQVRVQLRINDELELDTAWAMTQGVLTRAELSSYLRKLSHASNRTIATDRQAALEQVAPVSAPALTTRVQPIAFYLPQFHPTPENDEWWGKGFTEWNNVVTATAKFPGHEQPRRPSELGYYDLRTPGVMDAQIRLAKEHGLRGFCFHHYWMSGQKLLHEPLQHFLELDHDFGFCLCWANESWSRRWDGSDREILIEQKHRFEDDVNFIHDVLPMMRDPRYLTVNGEPMLIVYRISLLSDPTRVIDRWRQIAVEAGLPGLHVCMAETFDLHSPQDWGCDSSVEFPPHNLKEILKREPEGLDPRFSGLVVDYAQVVAHQLTLASAPYRRYPGAMLAWDNSSRKGREANIYAGFEPGTFELWLEHAAQRAEQEFPEGERYIFINGWNEWAEGSYLEPDYHWGRRNLEVVRGVAHGQASSATRMALLRQRLQDDTTAAASLAALESRIRGLEQSLAYALYLARMRHPQDLPSHVSPRVPPGLAALHPGGHGRVERVGDQFITRHCVIRGNERLSVRGWGYPGNAPIDEASTSYLRLDPLDDPANTTPRYALLNRRSQRNDVVRASGLDPELALWSGWSAVIDLSNLPAGTYRASLCFPAPNVEVGAAGLETHIDCTIEVLGS